MNPTLEPVCTFLTAHGYAHHVECDGNVVFVRMTLSHLAVNLFYYADPEAGSLDLLFRVPVRIPSDRRAPVAEFLMRINHSIRNGRFLLDYTDGEVTFRLTEVTGAVAQTDDLLGRWLYTACTTVDGLFPALMAVTYGRMNPSQAVEQGEAAYEALLGNPPYNQDAE